MCSLPTSLALDGVLGAHEDVFVPEIVRVGAGEQTAAPGRLFHLRAAHQPGAHSLPESPVAVERLLRPDTTMHITVCCRNVVRSGDFKKITGNGKDVRSSVGLYVMSVTNSFPRSVCMSR